MKNRKNSQDEDFEKACAEYYGDRWPQVRSKWEEDASRANYARAHYDGEGGLTRLELSLGLRPEGAEDARIEALVDAAERKIAAWERMTPSALMRDHVIISLLFSVTDHIHMSAAINQGRLPDCWWARLGIALDSRGLYDRLTDQIDRETNAQMAQEFLRDERSMGGKARAAKDPRSAAKAGALKLWQERHAGKHPKLRRVQDFATEVMRRWPELTNAKVIEGWSAKWTKDVKEGRTPSC